MKQAVPRKTTTAKPCCGLCGKTTKLTKTECCGGWICDDESNYQMFSYARNSCSRNHRRFTLCAFHFNEQHPGDWAECPQCRENFDTEDYVDYGTNGYNFRKLANPPTYEPTRCSKCNRIIVRAEGGFSRQGGNCFCRKCIPLLMP